MLYPLIVAIALWIVGFALHGEGLVMAGVGVVLGGFLVYGRQITLPKKQEVPVGLVPLVRRYSMEIQNGRTIVDIYRHYQSEHQELEDEWLMGDKGVDGIVGESIDIITCLLDLIIVYKPEMTDEEIMALALKKLDKWKLYYSDSIERDRSSE